MATKVTTVAKARGNSDKARSIIEVGIGEISFKFFCTYWPATSTKKIKPRIIKAKKGKGSFKRKKAKLV